MSLIEKRQPTHMLVLEVPLSIEPDEQVSPAIMHLLDLAVGISTLAAGDQLCDKANVRIVRADVSLDQLELIV